MLLITFFILEICGEHNQFLRIKLSQWLLKKEGTYKCYSEDKEAEWSIRITHVWQDVFCHT